MNCKLKAPGILTPIICADGEEYDLPPNKSGKTPAPPDLSKAAPSNSVPDNGAHAALIATSQNSTASVKYTAGINPGFGETGESFHYAQLSLTASAPVSKAADTTTLATQDGLANAAALDFEYAWYLDWWARGFDSTLAFGAFAKPAYQQYTYISANTLGSEQKLQKNVMSANQTVSKVPGSAGLYTGTTVMGPDMLFLHYEFQNTFTAQTAGVLCPTTTSSTGGAATCASGPINAPKRSEKSLLSLEYKYFMNGNIPVAIDFNPIYDTKSHIGSIDLPIYFVNNGSKSSLIGGLDVGWTSSNHKMTVGIVVSTPFVLFQPRN